MTANGDHEFSLDPCSPGSGDPATVIRGCGKSLSGHLARRADRLPLNPGSFRADHPPGQRDHRTWQLY